jgi:non-heme chloroperoxidase
METRFFTGHNGLQIAASVAGDPSHHPSIFLHGGGQTRHSWKRAAEDMAEAGYYVISCDLRGHGESGWAEGGDYSLEAQSGDLTALIGTLSYPPALVGASLGGVISLVTAGENPGIASAVVLVDVVPRMDQEGIAKIQGFMTSNREGFASVEEAADAVSKYMPHRPRPKNVGGLMKNLRKGEDGRLYWHWDPATRVKDREAHMAKMVERMESAARKLDIPALLVKGQISEVVNEEGVRALLELMPHAELADVQGAGHMVAGDSNDAFNSAVEDFLRRNLSVS